VNKTLPCEPLSVPELMFFYQSKVTRQHPNPTPNTAAIASTARQEQDQSPRTRPTEYAAMWGRSGIGMPQRGTCWRGTLGKVTTQRQLTATNGWSSCWSTLTSGGVSSGNRILLSWFYRSRFSQQHKPQILQPSVTASPWTAIIVLAIVKWIHDMELLLVLCRWCA